MLYPAQDLCSLLGGRLLGTQADVVVSGVAFDSRKVRKDDAFVAIEGAHGDGHQFISQAFAGGASLAIVSDEAKAEGHPGILVADTRRALSRLAAHFAAHPSDQLRVIGVTGTNGKTTTNWLIYHALNYLGSPCIRFGTLGVEAQGIISREGNLTTPDPIEIHSDLRRALDAGAKTAVLEASSHALDQSRIDDVAFDVGIFTNLTRDHLDYHGTLEDYFQAKRRLFELIARGSKTTKAAVIHRDAEFGDRFVKSARELGLVDYSFGTSASSRVRIQSFRQDLSGGETVLGFEGREFSIRNGLLGAHNAQNLAAAFGALVAIGLPPDRICEALAQSPQVPGRLERIPGAPFGIFVDYAHTPDALENVLRALRPLSTGKLWVVFGCGGDRDRGKRPQMAAVARQYADGVAVTSDNPRTENPRAILDEILSGGIQAEIVDEDRRHAIERTLGEAKAGDVVLIAGKGHENYQIIGTEKRHFSDQEVAREFLAKHWSAA